MSPFRRRLGAALLAALWVALPSAAHAARSKQVALFLVPKPGVDTAFVGALAGAVKSLSDSSPQVGLVPYRRLRKRIGRNPAKRISKCGSNFRCIAKLGRRVKAAEVLYGRLKQNGNTVTAQFIIVNVRSRKLIRRASFKTETSADLEATLGEHAEALLGIEPPPPPAADEEMDFDLGGDDFISALIDEPELALEPPTEAPTPTGEVPQDGHSTVASAGGTSDFTQATTMEQEPIDVDAPPDGDLLPLEQLEPIGPLEPIEPLETIETAEPTKVAGVDTGDPTTDAPVTLSASSPPRHSATRSLMLYGGLGVGGLGAAILGLGAYYGLDSQSIADSIADDTDLPAAVRLEQDANDAAGKANTFLGIGSVALALGSTAFAIALMEPNWLGGASVAVAPMPEGVGVSLGGTW